MIIKIYFFGKIRAQYSSNIISGTQRWLYLFCSVSDDDRSRFFFCITMNYRTLRQNRRFTVIFFTVIIRFTVIFRVWFRFSGKKQGPDAISHLEIACASCQVCSASTVERLRCSDAFTSVFFSTQTDTFFYWVIVQHSRYSSLLNLKGNWHLFLRVYNFL